MQIKRESDHVLSQRKSAPEIIIITYRRLHLTRGITLFFELSHYNIVLPNSGGPKNVHMGRRTSLAYMYFPASISDHPLSFSPSSAHSIQPPHISPFSLAALLAGWFTLARSNLCVCQSPALMSSYLASSPSPRHVGSVRIMTSWLGLKK